MTVALADANFPPTGRPTLAVLGKYAATKHGKEAAPVKRLLETKKAGAAAPSEPGVAQVSLNGAAVARGTTYGFGGATCSV